MESDQLKPELIAIDYSIYGHEITKQSHIDTAVERRGVIDTFTKIRRYMHVFKILLRSYQMQKNGLAKKYTEPFFKDYDIESMDLQTLFDLITEKAGFETIQNLRQHIIASEASTTLCIVIFMIAASNNTGEFRYFLFKSAIFNLKK